MILKTITKEDLEKPELIIYSEKSEVQLRRCNEPAPGCFIAESIRVIGRALDAGYEAISFLTEERHLSDPLMERLGDIPVYVGSPETLSSLAGYKLTGGALCLMQRRTQYLFCSSAGISLKGSILLPMQEQYSEMPRRLELTLCC